MATPTNPTSADERASLSKLRGQAAAFISDPKKKQAFIAAQGEPEGKGTLDAPKAARMRRQAEDTIATEGKNIDTQASLGSYRRGTKRVPRTGLYKLHKNEAVLNTRKASAYRRGKA